jgi:hypothetical protein
MPINPTAEQQAALDAFATGENVLIRAGAGTGKTSTLRLLGESAPERSILFIAFNSSVKADAAKSFPSNVDCLTSHGLANRALRRTHPDLMRKLNGPRQSPVDVSKALGIPYTGFNYGELAFLGYQLATIAMTTVRRFTYSADAEITGRHVERIEGATSDEQAQLEAFIVPFARKAWNDLISTSGRLSWGKSHDYYLKFWALTNPVLDYDAVMVDEAQDTNPCLSGIIANQTCQVVMVGDESQAIYGWRGARDAMGSFPASHVVTLSQSFRFGQAVADVANKFLDLLDAPLRLKGLDSIDSTVEPVEAPDAILCRTNATVIEYAMNALEQGRKPAIVGGTSEIISFANAAEKLMQSKRVTHADLSPFKNWGEVQEYANSDDGADLRVMTKLIDNYGVAAIREVCEASVNEGQADVIISTAHKAKGREWDTVLIAADFKAPEADKLPGKPELMLAYVAVTRAKVTLHNVGLSWVESLA